MKKAEHAFQFVTASYLTRIGNQSAANLSDLRTGLETCSDASVFYHTFQSLERHHFLTVGFSNDFAQWVIAALNRGELAEQLAALDLRNYLSLSDLRADLLRVTDDFCHAHPSELTRPAFEPFYFCESVEVTIPLGEAWTLEEFREGLNRLSNASFHFHFLNSRLRMQLQTNDFSLWFAGELGLETLARQTNRIDIYTNTLDDTRAKLLRYIETELST
jgi:Family of unknown function (DUF5752)